MVPRTPPADDDCATLPSLVVLEPETPPVSVDVVLLVVVLLVVVPLVVELEPLCDAGHVLDRTKSPCVDVPLTFVANAQVSVAPAGEYTYAILLFGPPTELA